MARVRITGATTTMDGEFSADGPSIHPGVWSAPPYACRSAITSRRRVCNCCCGYETTAATPWRFLVNGYPPALTRLEVQVNDVEDPDSFAIISPGDYTWLQVREMGGTLFFDASADGSIFRKPLQHQDTERVRCVQRQRRVRRQQLGGVRERHRRRHRTPSSFECGLQ